MTNDNNTTTMFYQGIVDCSIKVNGKIFQLKMNNAGTDYLKYVFAKTMCNYLEVNQWDTPGYVAIYKQIPDSDEEEFTLSDISISGRQLVDEVAGLPTAVTFTAYIRYDDIRERVDAQSSDKYIIYLLTYDDVKSTVLRHRLAEFPIKPSILAYITPGITATLNWTMRLKNAKDGE